MKLNITRPIAAYLKKQLDLTPDQEEIAVYGLQVIFYPLVEFGFICLAGWLLGSLGTTVIIAIIAALLRLFSYGAHSESPITCALLGIIVFPALGTVALIVTPMLNYSSLLLIIGLGFIVAIYTVWRLAPADSPAKPINSIEERKKLHQQSIITVLFITAIQIALLLLKTHIIAVVLAMSLGLWWQAFMLTSAGHWFATLLDKFIRWKGGKSR